MPRCPTCHRDFEAAGFCPFDGAKLEDVSNVATLQRLQPDMRAEAGAERVDDDSSGPVYAVSAADGGAQSAVDLLRKAKQESGDSGFERLIGKTLDGRYRIKSVLGEGGMGVVFLAEHVVIHKPVAIKILKKEATRDSSVSKRFVREARAASRIGHPNIIDVTDFGTSPNGITYSVMEYVEGSTLSKVIKYEAPLETPRILHIATQMARALAAAHAKGVVHRDLKPDNVFLVDRDGRADFVKIVDFGIARVLPIPGNSEISRLTRVGSVFGTPEYMAPEQASGRADTDHRVDIYALGTIVYEMFTGKVPHKAKSTVRTLAMQMLDPIPPMRSKRPDLDIPRELEQLVMKALAKDRDQRFEDMETLTRALSAFHTAAPSGPAAGLGSVPVGPQATTLVDGPETEVEVHPAGADAAETREYSGAGAAPTPGASTKAPTDMFDPPPPPAGEPAFLARKRQPDITQLDSEPRDSSDGAPVLVWLGGFVLAAAAAVVIVLLLRANGEEPRAQLSLDAGVAPVAAIDAAAELPAADAATAAVVDAAAGERPGTGRNPKTPVRRPRLDAGPSVDGPVVVEVITRPKGGSLYIGDDYAGSDGTHIKRPGGTALTVRCRKPGHEPGKVRLRFDGATGTAICRMHPRRTTKCVDGIKNPFDDCP